MERLRKAFAALGQPTRMRIFELLLTSGAGGMTHGEIGASLDVPKALLTTHLGVLEAEGLVTAEREGKFKRFRASSPRIREIAAELADKAGDDRGEAVQRDPG